MYIKECTKCKKGFYHSGFSVCPICGIPLVNADEDLPNISEWTEYEYYTGSRQWTTQYAQFCY